MDHLRSWYSAPLLGRTAWPRWFALILAPAGLLIPGMLIAFLSPEPIRTWLNRAVLNRSCCYTRCRPFLRHAGSQLASDQATLH